MSEKDPSPEEKKALYTDMAMYTCISLSKQRAKVSRKNNSSSELMMMWKSSL